MVIKKIRGDTNRLITDRTGEIYGRLLVVSYAYNKNRYNYWHTRCACGGSRITLWQHLKSGDTQTCGDCKRRGWKHRGHSMLGTPVYKTWSSMKSRCNIKSGIHNYNNYYARGITVCDKWLKFKRFYQDMGDRPKGMSIERIDNDKGYYKDNCKWATPTEQANNLRTNVRITYGGETKTATQWANIHGVSTGLILTRYHKGWPIDKLFSKPNTHRLHRRPLHKLAP